MTVPNTSPADLSDAAPAEEASRAIGQRVLELLTHKGLSARTHVATVAQILSLGTTQARRKLTGAGNWTIGEVAQMAAGLGVSTSALVDVLDQQAGSTAVPAELSWDGLTLTCTAWLGDTLPPGGRAVLVAEALEPNRYRVVRPSNAKGPHLRKVLRIELLPPKPTVSRIAVVDDDQDSCDNLAEYLTSLGMEATAFYSVATLRDRLAVDAEAFDGYIMDWYLGGLTCESLIDAARRLRPDVPIILLTGKVAAGEADQGVMADVIRSYKLEFFEKPAKLPIIAAKLQGAIATAR
jgi:CheY-like chemotaxis protein